MSVDLAPGAVVANRYRLERVVREGGMGMVWAATHTVTRKLVALKFLKAAPDPELRRRMLREARAACAVSHPNVVQIHDVLENDGSPVLVMEFLLGESLGQRLDRERALPLSELARVLLPVISAVGAAHEVGILHRDLKPDNIFLCTTQEGGIADVKVLDFGIAKLTATDGDAANTAGLTSTGALLGTPYYMSPEQVFAEGDIDHRTDIWSLGVIMYEALSGTLPTYAPNVGQVLKRIVNGDFQPLEQLAPGVPAEIATLVGRMLSRDRSGRPSELREIFDALTPFAGSAATSFSVPPPSSLKGSRGRPGSPSGRHSATGSTGPKSISTLPKLPQSALAATPLQTQAGLSLHTTAKGPSSSRRFLLVAGATVVTFAVGTSVWSLAHRNRNSVAPSTTGDVAPSSTQTSGAAIANPERDGTSAATPPATAATASAPATATASSAAISIPVASASTDRGGAQDPRNRPSAPTTRPAHASPTASSRVPGGLVENAPF